MKIYNLIYLFVSLLVSISSIQYNQKKDNIILCIKGGNGLSKVYISYYEDGNFILSTYYDYLYFHEEDEIILPLKQIEYDKIYIEIMENNEVVYEASINMYQFNNMNDINITLLDGYNKVVEVKYDLVNDIEYYKYNKYYLENLKILDKPRIIDISKMKINVEQDIEEDITDNYEAYLLLNQGFENGPFEIKEGFYRVPVKLSYSNNVISLSLKDKLYYDFEKQVMVNEMPNNGMTTNKLILSKNSELASEGYLIIEKCIDNKYNLIIDLLVKEKNFFGENGYYYIKEIN
ncbi:MAG: hypothetical protein SO253_00555 [Bacilli bacterium]|nr:hypothetical protein [Bacilli bacterium]